MVYRDQFGQWREDLVEKHVVSENEEFPDIIKDGLYYKFSFVIEHHNYDEYDYCEECFQYPVDCDCENSLYYKYYETIRFKTRNFQENKIIVDTRGIKR